MMTPFFSKPVRELAGIRRSVRTYQDKDLEPEVRQKLQDCLENVTGINGRSVKLSLVVADSAPNGAKIGTYGMIRGARYYMAAVVGKGDGEALLELGYVLEKAVLLATSLGLGTVWLGGTFNKGRFAKAVGLGPNEMLPIVVPVGYPSETMNLREWLMRKIPGSAHRKGWSELFFSGNIQKPLESADAAGLKDALEALRLAPSAINVQPWRIIKNDDGSFSFYEAVSQNQMGFDMHMIDMGIALCHFDLASCEAGHRGHFDFKKANGEMPHDLKYIASWSENASHGQA
ncbi:MAG: nitroreductase family protein [Clostridia bacterium]|nr:nitroreductase family protein [Clostridia bacterium]